MTEIRPARAEQAEAIRALVRAAYAMYVPRIGREPAPMTDDYAAQIAAAKVWVIDDEGELAGVVVLEDTPDALQVENVAVRPESQGRGLGRALLSFADDEARRRGYEAVILYTNVHMTENVEHYQKLGYVEVGRGHEHGFDRVFFEKRLPHPGGQANGADQAGEASVQAAMAKYYAARAPYYERVYDKPERQPDLARLRERVTALCAGKNVLEVACGSGYWTELIAPGAASIVAVDASEEMLAIARTKSIGPEKATFLRGDAYALPRLPRQFDAALVGFWWSHVPKARLRAFLLGLHRALEPSSLVIAFDNAYVEGSSTPLSRKDSDGNPLSGRDVDGNTYQERILDDGSVHQIVKNFPSEDELRADLDGIATNVEASFLTYYWLLTYRTARG
jgi:SAM-dependent methyltransferase/GNAT superfamily N-acetyltransferase